MKLIYQQNKDIDGRVLQVLLSMTWASRKIMILSAIQEETSCSKVRTKGPVLWRIAAGSCIALAGCATHLLDSNSGLELWR